MSNAEQTVPLDVMIRRLEEANARAHERVARARERVVETQQDAVWHPSDQQKTPAVPDRRSLRRSLSLALFGSMAATVGVAFVWQSTYFDAAKLIVGRWASLAQTTAQIVAPTAAPISPELAQRLQTIANDLANLTREIERLKTSEEQTARDNAAVGEQLKAALSQMARDNTAVSALKAALSQITRDNAAVAEQLRIALSQMTRDNAAVVEQLKTTQEQTVRLATTRGRRKPVPALPQVQAQPEATAYSALPRQQ